MIECRSVPLAAKRRPRILIIEDDIEVALLMGEMVRELDYKVSGIAHTIMGAREEIAKRNFDCVLLDIDLDEETDPEIADLMLERVIPFAFVTGYDYLVEPRHESVPLLQKPFTLGQLRALLTTLLGVPPMADDLAETA